tara:strand:- start:69733 stop:69936 length:204 start_codon:yes stop_codon:yes gene_type:complete
MLSMHTTHHRFFAHAFDKTSKFAAKSLGRQNGSGPFIDGSLESQTAKGSNVFDTWSFGCERNVKRAG